MSCFQSAFNGLSLGRGVQAERQRAETIAANMGYSKRDIWKKLSQ